jgi:adenylate cyclase
MPGKYMLMMAAGQLINFAWRIGVTAEQAQPFFDEAIAVAREVGDARAATLITVAYGRLLAATGSADDYVAKVREALVALQLPRDRSLHVTLTAILSHALRLAGLLREALAASDEALEGVGDISATDVQTLGFDVGVWLRGGRAQTLTWLGRFDEATELANWLVSEEDSKIDTLNRMIGHGVHIDVAWCRRLSADVQSHADRMLALAQQAQNPYLLVYAQSYKGLAHAVSGQWPHAVEHLQRAIGFARQKKAGLENEPRMLGDLATILFNAGDKDGALRIAQEGMRIARGRGARLPLIFVLRNHGAAMGADPAMVKSLIAESGLWLADA